jgi:excisionase family DNA binding protein
MNTIKERPMGKETGRSLDTETLLTVDELAEGLRVKNSWVYGQTRKNGPGSIPRIRVGKYLRFEWHKVKEWLRKQQD